jgi:predicted transcriptional regulator YdeE
VEPQIIKKPEIILTGIVGTGPSVNDIDIAGLWDRFTKIQPGIKHKIETKDYELHIEEEASPRMHFCLVGEEVTKIEALPLETFVKVIPDGTYALFTHHFSDGGYGDAFKAVYNWIKESDYKPAHAFDIQVYDNRFKGPSDPESVIEIHIPVIHK